LLWNWADVGACRALESAVGQTLDQGPQGRTWGERGGDAGKEKAAARAALESSGGGLWNQVQGYLGTAFRRAKPDEHFSIRHIVDRLKRVAP